jgi:hypothetical protein
LPAFASHNRGATHQKKRPLMAASAAPLTAKRKLRPKFQPSLPTVQILYRAFKTQVSIHNFTAPENDLIVHHGCGEPTTRSLNRRAPSYRSVTGSQITTVVVSGRQPVIIPISPKNATLFQHWYPQFLRDYTQMKIFSTTHT